MLAIICRHRRFVAASAPFARTWSSTTLAYRSGIDGDPTDGGSSARGTLPEGSCTAECPRVTAAALSNVDPKVFAEPE